MKIKEVYKFQEGGEMPVEATPAPAQETAPAADEAMMQQLAQVANQIIQEMGPEAAAMLAQIIMEMVQSAAQPASPTFQRKGGKLIRI